MPSPPYTPIHFNSENSSGNLGIGNDPRETTSTRGRGSRARGRGRGGNQRQRSRSIIEEYSTNEREETRGLRANSSQSRPSFVSPTLGRQGNGVNEAESSDVVNNDPVGNNDPDEERKTAALSSTFQFMTFHS